MDPQHQHQQHSRYQPAARDPAMTSINEPHKTQALKPPSQPQGTRKAINCINCGKAFKSRTKLMKHVFSAECQPISQPSQRRAAHPTAVPEKAAIPHNFEQPQQAQHTSDHTHGYQPHGYHHISHPQQPQQRQPTRRPHQGSSRQQHQPAHQAAPQAAQGDLSHVTHKYQYNSHQSQYVGHGYFIGNQYHVNHSEDLSQPGSHERSISATPTSATTSAYSALPRYSALPMSYSGGYSARPSARCAPVASSSDEWSDRSSSGWESSGSQVGSDVSRAGGDRSDCLDHHNDEHVHEIWNLWEVHSN